MRCDLRRLLLGGLLAPALVACSADPRPRVNDAGAGDASTDAGPNGDAGSVDGMPLASLNAECEANALLTGAQALARFEGPRADDAIFGAAMTTVHLTFTYDDGAITCFPPRGGERARLDIIMKLAFRTDDGAFDETLPVVVSTWGDAPSFAGRKAHTDLAGAWNPAEIEDFGAAPEVEFRGTWFPASLSGNACLIGAAPTWCPLAW